MSEAPDLNETGELDADVLTIDTPADGQADNTPSAEDRAMAMGWTPKTQFKGDPEKWVDAETFVKRGEEFLPFLKANNRRLEQALERSQTKLDGVEKTLAKFAEHHSKTEQRAYARAMADLRTEIAQSAANGDVQGVMDATDALAEMQAEAKAAPLPTPAPEDLPEMRQWEEANPWYGKDRAMTAAAVAIGAEVYEEGFSGKAQIKEVDRRMREQFPDKFAKAENPNRRHAATVEGAGTPPRRNGKSYADLPVDAKAACDDFVKRVPGFTREKYVKDYFQ